MTDKDTEDKNITEVLVELLQRYSGGTNQEVEQPPETPIEVSTTVKKTVDVEQRKAMFIVLQPCSEGSADLHGDIYTAEEIEKGADSFNTYCGQANVQHAVDTEHAQILESYITPVEFTLDTGKTVLKGSWIQTWKFLETEQGEYLWKGVKDGTFTGLSIGCTAMTEEI